jgi:hypothetical protein
MTETLKTRTAKLTPWLLHVRWKLLGYIIGPSLAADLLWLSFYPRPSVIGLLGDVYNFAAALWLAFDLLFKERETERKEILGGVRSDAQGHNIPFEVDGMTITSAADVEKVLARRAAKEASSACILLFFGLFLVLAARLLEFVEQGHVEELWRMSGH